VRILFDNCVPAKLAPHIRGHDVLTAVEMGWADLDDGELLNAINSAFDVFLTTDQNILHQQNVVDRPFAIVVLQAKSNQVEHVARPVSKLLRVMKDIAPGAIHEIS
jgi:predicted nuclease of predicted toxin-antitoxin system